MPQNRWSQMPCPKIEIKFAIWLVWFIKKQTATQNVLAIYERKLLLQSYQAQVLLKVAAYDNGNFNIPLLASVCGFPEEIVVLLLELLSEAGQISKLDSTLASYVFNHN